MHWSRGAEFLRFVFWSQGTEFLQYFCGLCSDRRVQNFCVLYSDLRVQCFCGLCSDHRMQNFYSISVVCALITGCRIFAACALIPGFSISVVCVLITGCRISVAWALILECGISAACVLIHQSTGLCSHNGWLIFKINRKKAWFACTRVLMQWEFICSNHNVGCFNRFRSLALLFFWELCKDLIIAVVSPTDAIKNCVIWHYFLWQKRCHLALQENIRVLHIAEGNRFPAPLIFNQNMIFNILRKGYFIEV